MTVGLASNRAIRNMTNQVKNQLHFLRSNLANKRIELRKAQKFLKYNLPGTKSMIAQHERGIKKVEEDIRNMKIRIDKMHRQGKIFKVR